MMILPRALSMLWTKEESEKPVGEIVALEAHVESIGCECLRRVLLECSVEDQGENGRQRPLGDALIYFALRHL
jgi:hypothetical protein